MVFRPSTLLISNIEAILEAGPAISKTNALPGLSPFNIRATAMGIEPVAHKYIGMESNKTINILTSVFSLKTEKKSAGTNRVIKAAKTKPKTSHLPISFIISTKA